MIIYILILTLKPSNTGENPDSKEPVNIPEVYPDLREILAKAKTLNCSYDCAIDFKTCAILPRSSLLHPVRGTIHGGVHIQETSSVTASTLS